MWRPISILDHGGPNQSTPPFGIQLLHIKPPFFLLKTLNKIFGGRIPSWYSSARLNMVQSHPCLRHLCPLLIPRPSRVPIHCLAVIRDPRAATLQCRIHPRCCRRSLPMQRQTPQCPIVTDGGSRSTTYKGCLGITDPVDSHE